MLTVIALVLVGQAGALPPDRTAMIATARAAVERQDIPTAITTLEAARAANPGDPEILRLLGSAYAYAHRYPEAVATLSQAERLAPADLDIKAALARAYLWSGDRAAAERELAQIEARDPGNADARQIRAQLDTASETASSGRLRDDELARIDFQSRRQLSKNRDAGGNPPSLDRPDVA